MRGKVIKITAMCFALVYYSVFIGSAFSFSTCGSKEVENTCGCGCMDKPVIPEPEASGCSCKPLMEIKVFEKSVYTISIANTVDDSQFENTGNLSFETVWKTDYALTNDIVISKFIPPKIFVENNSFLI